MKTQDYSIAELYGISEYPVLVYFEANVPNVYEGSLKEEEEVLQWLIQQKTEDRIELITRVMLESMVEETQYLAVYFCKSKFLLSSLDCLFLFACHLITLQIFQISLTTTTLEITRRFFDTDFILFLFLNSID